MLEKRTEIAKYQGLVRTIPSYQQLVKTNRLLLGAVIFLMFTVIALGLVYAPDPELLLANHKAAATANAQGINPVISPEVNALKGQLIGLLSGSIDNKLKSLETSIKSGSVNTSLSTLQDLKNDVNTLRSYSDTSKETPKKPELSVSNQDLAKEINHLKDLIYMSLASCGLMFAAAAGVWVKYRKRLPYKDEKAGFLGRR